MARVSKTKVKNEKRAVRHRRIRARVIGTSEKPRLAVYRSNRYVYAQLIDDAKGVTLGAASSVALKGTELENAKKVGQSIATVAKEKGIKAVVFDRGGFLYAGKIKALADSAREAGLSF
jgi:large subunit ribosomal protein L18